MKEHRKHSRLTYAKRILREVIDHPANADRRGRAVARALRWQVHKALRATPVDVPFAGFTLRCYPDSASASNVMYFTPQFDWDAMAFLEAYLRPGEGFIDVGANIGTYTLLAASLTRSPQGAGLIALEPLESAAGRLQENLDRNGLPSVTVHRVAALDRDGTVGFLDFDVASTVDGDVERRGRTPITVPCQRLDHLIQATGIGAAKLDVEGVELQALVGASALIERRDPAVWLVELMEWQLAKHGGSIDAVVAWMGERGYQPWWYDANSATLRNEREAWMPHHNAIFIADEHLAEVERRLLERGRLRP